MSRIWFKVLMELLIMIFAVIRFGEYKPNRKAGGTGSIIASIGSTIVSAFVTIS